MRTMFIGWLCLLGGIISLVACTTPVAAQGEKWAIIVGVGDYEDPAIQDLPYAPEDARLLYEMLLERGGFKATNVRLMVDDSADDLRPTGRNIRDALRLWLGLRANPGDMVVFYFSGHGAATGDTGYLVPIDAQGGDEIPYTSVDLKLVRERLAGCDASQVIAILDSCFSGLGKAEGERMGAGYAKTLRVVPEEPLPEGKVRVTLTSCREKEESWPLDLLAPVSKANRSVFTYYLFAGLEGVADTSPADGVVTVKEAYDYASDRVVKWAERNQVVQRPDIAVYPEGTRPEIPFVTSAPASLEVVSQPLGAGIFLDGEDTRALTPATIRPLASGEHSLGLKAPPGYENWQGQVTLARGEKKRVEVSLTALPATLRLTSTPPGATVFVNGEQRGATPLEISVSFGQCTVRFELAGHEAQERTVSLAPGQSHTLEAALPAVGFGKVAVNASPWAKVFLDGVEIGLTPLTIEDVVVGEHTVRLEYEGQTLEAEVKVEVNETATVSHSF